MSFNFGGTVYKKVVQADGTTKNVKRKGSEIVQNFFNPLRFGGLWDKPEQAPMNAPEGADTGTGKLTDEEAADASSASRRAMRRNIYFTSPTGSSTGTRGGSRLLAK